MKELTKHTYIILPSVHPALKAYYVIKALILFCRIDTRCFDYICLSKGVDIYLSNTSQKVRTPRVCQLIVQS